MATKTRERRNRRLTSARDTAKKSATFEWTSLNVPEGTTMFQPKEATYYIDIIPYEVTQKGNPNADKGDLHYERTYYAHRGIGPDESTYACLRKSFKQKCPICEHKAKLQKDPDHNEDLVDSLKEKKRQLFNVIVRGQEDKGVQVWDVSYYLFGKFLDKKIKNADEDDQESFDNFHDPEKGMTLKVGITEEHGDSYTYLEASDIEFRKRKEQYEESIVDDAHDLDEMVRRMDYDELKKIFDQVEEDDEDEDEDDEDESPRKKKSKVKSRKDRDDDDEDDEDEPDEDDDDEEDERPAKKKKSRKDDEDDEDEDEGSEGPEFGKQDYVSFEYRGKKLKGKISVVDEKKDLYHIHCNDESRPRIVAFDDDTLKLIKRAEPEEDDEDEEETPKKGKAKTSSKSKSSSKKASRDTDDEDDEDEDDDEEPRRKTKSKKSRKDDDDEDDEDDIPFDEDDEEEEDERPRKKKARR